MTGRKPRRRRPMLDPKRDPKSSYHINASSNLPPEYVYVTTYPPMPEEVRTGTYRRDVLPRWMVEAMALLDAGHPETIYNIGVRVGENSYWIEPVEG
jgi:hypothetical protein